MNFFERQDLARRKSALLVAYFIAAVLLIIVAVNLCVWLLLHFLGSSPAPSFQQWAQTPSFWKWAAVTASLILGGSLVQFLQLRSGGEAVAQMVRARPIPFSSKHPNERRLINVVEEMSIAAGVALPRLYVMDREPGINAFVAGYRPDQAVLVVTRGTLEQLDRDELQGVVGHEFSHILNGDMRLNIRLISVLAGILLIGQVGEFLLRTTRYVGRDRESAKAAPLFLVGGICLVAVGYIGLFFGRLIKAAVSRQREYLADAASVQFTRNPQGLASALYKIRTSAEGSLLNRTLHAEDMSHMCFGETVQLRFNSLFASHPPLDQRIQAIDPKFMTLARIRRNQQRLQEQQSAQGALATGASSTGTVQAASQLTGLAAARLADAPQAGLSLVPKEPVAPTSDPATGTPRGAFQLKPRAATGDTQAKLKVSDLVGHPQSEHFTYAEKLLASWPPQLFDYAHTPAGAISLACALLIKEMQAKDQPHALQLVQSKAAALGLDTQALQWGIEQLPGLERSSTIPLLELCLGSLKALDPLAQELLLDTMKELIVIDKRYSLFEFVVFSILRKQLAPKASRAQKVRFHSFKPLKTDIQKVLAVLARVGSQSREEMEQAYGAIIRRFDKAPLPLPARCTLTELTNTLERLSALSPLLKDPFLQSCADLILYDGKVGVEEYELLRVVAEFLECPMPPMPTNP